MIVKYILPILLLSAVSIVGKLIFLTLGGLAAGQELKISLQAGAAQTQVGEFSFIIAGLGQSLSVTGAFLYPIIVAVSVITTFTTPFVLKFATPLNAFLIRVLPKKWLRGIESYSSGKQEGKTPESRDWSVFLKRYFGTFALYGVLGVGTILIGTRVLHPFLLEMLDKSTFLVACITCCAIYLVLAILIAAMLRTNKHYFTSLWLDSVYNRFMLIFLLLLRVAAAILLAVIPAFLLFHVNPLWMAVAAVPVIFLIARSKTLAGRYLEVEARFLANFNERKLAGRFAGENADEEEAHLWLTEQLFVATLLCPDPCLQEGRSLQELDWGRLHHIKVIQILRGKERLNIPDGKIRLRRKDRLVVLGDRKALENFCLLMTQIGLRPEEDFVTLKTYIESQEGIAKSRQLLCCGVTLEKDSPQQGKSIRDSGIKEEWSAFLIGLERNHLPISDPDPNLNLRTGDLLWVMGSQEMASRLMRTGLLD